jgi:hypothetical protein
MKQISKPKQAKRGKNKDVLFLTVSVKSKKWFLDLCDQQVGHQSQSTVAERLLVGLQKHPEELKKLLSA